MPFLQKAHGNSVAADSRACSSINYVNGKTLAILEKFAGEAFVNINGQTTPDSIGSARAYETLFSLTDHIKDVLLVQSVFKNIFKTSHYSFETGDVVMSDTLANILTRANALKPADPIQNKAY